MSLSRCVDPPRSDLRLSLGGCLRFKTFELNFTTPIEDRMMEDLHDLRFTRAHQVARLSINKIILIFDKTVKLEVSAFTTTKANYSPSIFIDISTKGPRILPINLKKTKNIKI